MDQLTTVIGLTLLAGFAMPVGAAIASIERIKPRWLEEEFRHSLIAFGGGALLSAVAFVLVPDGIIYLKPAFATFFFCGGGLAFMGLDIMLYKMKTSASQLAAMLSDFIPESLALGASIAMGESNYVLLASLITLQNLPEGFNAYRELSESSSYQGLKIITMFTVMALLGPIAGVSGYVWLSDYPTFVATIMLFASGGILYSVFQDIAPQVKLEKHWAPSIGAVFGFVVGMVGHMLLGGG